MEQLHAEVASVLDWWMVAGVAHDVGEMPRDWLAPPRPAPQPDAGETATPVVADALPATLDAFLPWLATAGDAALLGPAALRVAPVGNPAADLMILIDLPEADDVEAGGLLSGPVGRLLDRMLAAIGRSRDTVWLAPLLPARPPGGRIDAATLPALADLARHHVALVAPKTLVLMGEQAARGLGGGQPRGRVHTLDLAGTPVATVATFGPSMLLTTPRLKREAWADLRFLLESQIPLEGEQA